MIFLFEKFEYPLIFHLYWFLAVYEMIQFLFLNVLISPIAIRYGGDPQKRSLSNRFTSTICISNVVSFTSIQVFVGVMRLADLFKPKIHHIFQSARNDFLGTASVRSTSKLYSSGFTWPLFTAVSGWLTWSLFSGLCR